MHPARRRLTRFAYAHPEVRSELVPFIRTAADLLPIMEPEFNLREIVKHLLLLEDHLFHPRKRCPDCIKKHLLMLEALAEEAITLDTEQRVSHLTAPLPEQIRKLQAVVKAGAPMEEVAQVARRMRKGLVDVAFGLKIASSNHRLRDHLRRLALEYPELQGMMLSTLGRRTASQSFWQGVMKLAVTMSVSDAYQVMGLPQGTPMDQVKKQYRSLALQHHPDRGGDLRKMQELNAAWDVIRHPDRPRLRTPEPTYQEQDEQGWAGYEPRPSGRYTPADLRRFADAIVARGYRQVVVRRSVEYAPMDAFSRTGDRWEYYRPFGAKGSTKRLPENVTADNIVTYLSRAGVTSDNLLDLQVTQGGYGAWATWRVKRGKYQSISFEAVKAPKKKSPDVGMSPAAVESYLRKNGFAELAGGGKNSYWGPVHDRRTEGLFIRLRAKTLRVIERERRGRKLEDIPLAQEVYYGAITTEHLDLWMAHIRKGA